MMTFFQIIAAAAVAYLLLLLLVFFFGNYMAYPAPRSTYTDENIPVIKIEMPNGVKISALVMENKKSDKWILHSHGNGEDLLGIKYPLLDRLVSSGYSVIAYDYCGYGTSEGRANEENSCLAAESVWKFLTEKKGVKPENIILMGFSIGSVSAAHLAAGMGADARALVLVGPVASASYSLLPVNILPWRFLDNISRMKKVRADTLFIHGEKDRTLNCRNSKILYAACAAKRKELAVFPELRHNCLPEEEIYWTTLLNFLDGVKK